MKLLRISEAKWGKRKTGTEERTRAHKRDKRRNAKVTETRERRTEEEMFEMNDLFDEQFVRNNWRIISVVVFLGFRRKLERISFVSEVG
ncbi:MAG: hypothetical protein ACTS4V_01645 [Candidatus Hodgkinia cicadicola]